MDFRRLFDILPYQQARYPQKVALAFKRDNHWKTFSTEACIRLIDKVSAGMLDLGLNKGDKVGIMMYGGNPYWNFLDLGLQQIGVVVVPLHPNWNQKDLTFILKDSDIKYCIVFNRELYDNIAPIQQTIRNFKGIFTIEPLPDLPSWDNLLTEPNEKHLEALQAFKAAIHEDDLATIIYTSGTSGTPKGVMLSHKNIISNIKSTIAISPINCDKRVFSFLPLTHIFERTITYSYLAVGASIYYANRPDTLMEEMREIRPHYFTAVPRLLEKMYEFIVTASNSRSSFSRRVTKYALKIGKKYTGDVGLSLGYWLQLQLADVLVYRHWRRALGGKVEGVAVGASALQPELSRLFSAAGVEIREGYGLTETAPIVSFNRFDPGGTRFGTVGIPIPGVEVKIDNPDEEGEGEILVKGPNIMLGYYNRPELTQKVINSEGWLHTGDVGKIVFKKFLKITDRKNDIFKTSSGKFVAPQKMETLIKTSPYIEQVLIIGYNKPFLTALVVPSFTELKDWAEEQGIHWTAPQFMVHNTKVVQFLEEERERLNESLPNYQKVRKYTLLHEEWTEHNGMLTPTLKPRRKAIETLFEKEVQKMYSAELPS